MKTRRRAAIAIAVMSFMPLLALAESELRYTCDPDGSIEVHLSEFTMFQGKEAKFKGQPVPWERTIPIKEENWRPKQPIRLECRFRSKVYIVEIAANWEGNLSEPAIEGHTFFPSVSIQGGGESLLNNTNLGICQVPCPGDWAVRVFLYLDKDKPVVTVHRLYLDWISQ